MATVATYLWFLVLIGYCTQHDAITALPQKFRSLVNPISTKYRVQSQLRDNSVKCFWNGDEKSSHCEGPDLFEISKIAGKTQTNVQQVEEHQPWKNLRNEEGNSLRTARETNEQTGTLETDTEEPRKPPQKERNTKKHWKLEKDLAEKLVIARRKQLEKERSKEETRLKQIKEEEELQLKLDELHEKQLNERKQQLKKEEEEERKALEALKSQNVTNYEEEMKVDEKLERNIQTNLERAREEEGPDSKSVKNFEASLAEVRERQRKRAEDNMSELEKYRKRQKELENLPKTEVTNTPAKMRTIHAVYVGCYLEKDCKKNPLTDSFERQRERERQQKLQREKAERIALLKQTLTKYREREQEIEKKRQQEVEVEQGKVQVMNNAASMLSPSSLLNVVDEIMPVLNPTQFPQETR